MADRITIKHLQALALRLNTVTGSPTAAWLPDASGKYRAQIGNYHIDQAYGGYSLHRMSNESGGVSNIFGIGHVPARTLYEQMQEYLRGLDDGRAMKKGE